MEETMSDRLDAWEARIIRWGIFLTFVVTFGEFIIKKIWAVLSPWF
jgi:hypothetical protein